MSEKRKPGRPKGSNYPTRRTHQVGLYWINKELFHTKYQINDEGCWIWQGAHGPHGALYGVRYGDKIRMTQATRVGWMLANGEIAPETAIVHECNNKSCVNPDHLKETPSARHGHKGWDHPRQLRHEPRKVSKNTPKQWILTFNIDPEQNPINTKFKQQMAQEIDAWAIARHGIDLDFGYSWITITEQHAWQLLLKYPEYAAYMRPLNGKTKTNTTNKP